MLTPDGEKVGEIYDVMLDKRSGRIAYAVMSAGGLLGLGTRYHPLPWHALKYVDAGGYVVGIPKEALQNAQLMMTVRIPGSGLMRRRSKPITRTGCRLDRMLRISPNA